MTNEQIIKLAERAAQSAWDAHQSIGEMPSAEMAYEFTREVEAEVASGVMTGDMTATDDDDARYDAAFDSLEMTALEFDFFEAAYALECAKLIRPTLEATR